MARIGRQVDHFEEIDIQSIRADFSPDRRYRYTLMMQFRKDLLNGSRSKTVTVILKNPSSADEKRSDATIRKVETYVWHHFRDAGYLNILNIFGIRATDASEVNLLLRESGPEIINGPENDRFFRDLLMTTNNLICAWGGPSGIQLTIYDLRLTIVRDLIRNHYQGPVYHVCGKQVTKEPLHGLMWGYDYELKPFAV
jgi:hypothetical protein